MRRQSAIDILKARTPIGIVKIVDRLLATISDAEDRIEKEGHVVRDMKGSVIPHPAIKILESSEKQLLEILKIYGV
jgi:hypothetical protein